MSFVHLHTHTVYSLLDGFSNIKKLVKRAKEMGMPALAITDHGTMFGAIEFYNAAKAVGIKPIIGVETYMAARGMQDRDSKLDKKSSHLLLLAENEVGYKNLLKLTSKAQMEGFYYYPRIDHELLAEHAEGLICTSGCMSAEIPRDLIEERPDEAVRRMNWYYDVFGPDRFYVELQHHNIAEITDLNRQLVELGAKYSAKFVATNDVHYIEPEDAEYQDVLLAIQTGKSLKDPDRMRYDSQTFYLRSPQEMSQLFAEIPAALSNTIEIAERCEVDLGFKGYHLPEFDVPEGFTPETYLRHLCEIGLEKRYGSRKDALNIRERLDFELGVIHEMGFNAYFLIVWDLCRHAAENNIWYNTRGSAAGSIVAYSLFITLVDPIEHQLLFERFLNPGRISMPDIDLDFRDDRRAEMLEYCARKYGDDKVAQIITFGTMAARGALRDVARVMDISIPDVDRVAKLVPNVPGKPVSLTEALEQVPDLKKIYDTDPVMRNVINTAIHMEGVVRNAGTHAAGVVIADKPLTEYLPIHRPTSNSEETPIKTVTQFEMGILDSMGMLKVDFLGLSTLTVMARACDLIRERTGKEYDLSNIPTDDPKTFELLGEGKTAGIFQMEGSGMTRWVIEMKPRNLDNIIAMVALYRPGPMDFIPDYIKRMHGEAPIVYRHPSLAPIFGDTYGIPVYQEQIMRASVEIGGFTRSESDDLRKAISKKMADKIAENKEKFVKGAVEKGVMDKLTATAIFEDWEQFARYGFNKSHAADYGLVAVQTAYLKAHYPAEYMSALMTVFKDSSDKVALYISDARSMGIEVLPPDIDKSLYFFSIEDCPPSTGSGPAKPAIRFGMGAVKNVGQGPVDAVLAARKKDGADAPFVDANDFIQRVDLRAVGKRALECLIKVGAFDRFGSRAGLLAALDQMVAASTSHMRAVQSGQLSMFGGASGIQAESIHIQDLTTDRKDTLAWERELLGLYLSDHPLSSHAELLTRAVSHNSISLNDAGNQERVRVAGLVVSTRAFRTKTGKMMGFVTIEDMQGNIELVVFPKTWDKSRHLCEEGKVLIIDGKADGTTPPKVLVDEIKTDVTFYESVAAGDEYLPPAPGASGADSPKPALVKRPESTPRPAPAPRPVPVMAAESASDYTADPEEDDGFFDDMPPPPESPPEWNDFVLPETPLAAAPPPPAPAAPLDDMLTLEQYGSASKSKAAPAPVIPPPVLEPIAQRPIAPPPTLVELQDDGLPPRIITVYLRPSSDQTRDRRRIKNVYGILISHPGKDRFSFYVTEEGRGHLIDFPNDSTRICVEMLDRLKKLLGSEDWRVEEIQFQ